MKRHQHQQHQGQEQEQTTRQQQGAEQQSVMQFSSPEEMLRHDAAQNAVPPAVAERLQKSIEREPKPARGWWQRLFGGS